MQLAPLYPVPTLNIIQCFTNFYSVFVALFVPLLFLSFILLPPGHFCARYCNSASSWAHCVLFSQLFPFFFSRFMGCVVSPVRCCSSWAVHPSFAPTLSATHSSNLLFVWKPSIIFLSMTHWPKASRRSTPSVFFLLWSHVFVLVKQLGSQK